jgi:hypothetical protein
VDGLQAPPSVPARPRSKILSTVALRPIELSALARASIANPAGLEPALEPGDSTVEMVPLEMVPLDDEEPSSERPTASIAREDISAYRERPTLELSRRELRRDPARPPSQPSPPPSSAAPTQMLADGSAPVRRPRGTRRSCEMLRVDDIDPDGDERKRR